MALPTMGSVLFDAAVAIFAIVALNFYSRRIRLPPGPRGLPLVGNLLEFPTEYLWLTFAKWAARYGDIISVRVLGHRIIVLNSAHDVREILFKRSTKTVGRMPVPMLEHAGWTHIASVLPPDRFHIAKRFTTKALGPSALQRFANIEDEEVTACVRRILTHSGSVAPTAYLRPMAGSTILRITYGYRISTDDDSLVKIAEEALDIGLALTAPGWIINSIPWLRHMPDWMFGPQFVRYISRAREVSRQVQNIPVEWARQQLAAGTAEPSLVADLFALPENDDTRIMFGALNELYAAAIDTVRVTVGAGISIYSSQTVSATTTLLLVLALHPDVQAKAQREVDSVTRGERLPKDKDRPHMPYVTALIKEVFRYGGIANYGLPHRAIQNIEYKGYTIPEDSIIFANIWAILHDPMKYPEPFKFAPERFLEENPSLEDGTSDADIVNEDPTRYIFGFGLRKCPGRHVADLMVFLVAAKVLATCDVTCAVNECGEPLTPESVKYSGGIISQPLPFKCTVHPRPNAAALLA